MNYSLKLKSMLESFIPTGPGTLSLEVINARTLDSETTSALVATIRAIHWGPNDEARPLINIIEQEIFIAPLKYRWKHVLEYLEAWERVLTDIVQVNDERFLGTLPREFTMFKTHPLELRATGVDAYEAALRHHSRLGKWLD